MAKSTDAEIITKIPALRPIEETVAKIQIIGVTPVIPHKWSEKSIRQMAEKQQTQMRAKRAPKDPEAEAEASCYWLEGNGAVPAVSFKAAMVGACRFFEGITMTMAKLLFYVEGYGAEQLVPVGSNKKMRCDTPRNASGVPDLRYRYQFDPWEAELRIHYLPSMISLESALALLGQAGRGGVGDWRPSAPKSATGTYGQFRVRSDGE